MSSEEEESGEIHFPLNVDLPRGKSFEFIEENLMIDETQTLCNPHFESGITLLHDKVEKFESLDALERKSDGYLKIPMLPNKPLRKSHQLARFRDTGPEDKKIGDNNYVPSEDFESDILKYGGKLDNRMVNLSFTVKGEDLPDRIETLKDAPIDRSILKNFVSDQITTVQALSIPFILSGRDVLVRAPEGTGKTTSFLLALVQKLLMSQRKTKLSPKKGVCRPKALVLAPVRELVVQIYCNAKELTRGTSISCGTVFGGACKSNERSTLEANPHILVATIGRLLDYVGESLIDFKNLDVIVFDEIMELEQDEGIVHVVEHVSVPAHVQFIMYTSTELEDKQKCFIQKLFKRPLSLNIGPFCLASDMIEQRVLQVGEADKKRMLLSILEKDPGDQFIIFVSSKEKADFLTSYLQLHDYPVSAIHADLPQKSRFTSLRKLKTNEIMALVATDVASKGIFLPWVSQVVNYDLPCSPTEYLQRIGKARKRHRTGRATSFYDEMKDWILLRFLVKTLNETGNKMPKWMESQTDSTLEPLANLKKKLDQHWHTDIWETKWD